MELLVIGLDGMDRRLIEQFDMPFLQGLLGRLHALPVKEDLWSRGWVKVLSGLPGTHTGAFYEQPALNGTAAFTQSFGSKNYPKNAPKRPLWEAVDALGKRAAWLNLPTMMPAPALNGIVLGGAGGGFSPEVRIPEVACHPTSIRETLVRERMIWENRYVVSGIRHTDLFFEKCTEALWRRVKIYCDLVADHAPFDLGFFVQKEPVIITNIYMHSVEELKKAKKPYKAVHYLLNQFFSALDDTLKYTVDRLAPKHVMVVSDHGAAPYRKSMNINAMLDDLGFLVHQSQPQAPKPGLLNKVKSKLVNEVRSATGTHTIDRFPSFRPVDHGRSRAFGNSYVPGIYVNDVRFGARDPSAKEVELMTDELCSAFNAMPLAKEHHLRARPFRREHAGTPAFDLLPDVWIDHPEDLFPEGRGAAVQKNPNYRDWSELGGLTRDIGSGKKSADALCVVDPAFLGGIDPRMPGLDLTVVHQLVLNHFQR
jgi:predicted AlkP superfamily phosphohydrolase/phosphomutase